MIGPILGIASRVVTPTLGRVFVEQAVRAVGYAVGTAAATYAVKKVVEKSQQPRQQRLGVSH